MLRKNTKIELLRHVPLFSQCSKKQLAEIAAIADEISLPEGRVLIAEGERGRQFYVVIEGTVDVTKSGRTLPVRGGREFFGEVALLSDVPTSATVTATSSVRALVIADRAFKSLLTKSPTIQVTILQALADRVASDSL